VPIPVDIKTRLDLDSLSKSGEDLRRAMEQAGGRSAKRMPLRSLAVSFAQVPSQGSASLALTRRMNSGKG
jgi:hypothetical protein